MVSDFVAVQPYPLGELLRNQVPHRVAAVDHNFHVLLAAQSAPHIGGPGAEVASGGQHVDTPCLFGFLSVFVIR